MPLYFWSPNAIDAASTPSNFPCGHQGRSGDLKVPLQPPHWQGWHMRCVTYTSKWVCLYFSWESITYKNFKCLLWKSENLLIPWHSFHRFIILLMTPPFFNVSLFLADNSLLQCSFLSARLLSCLQLVTWTLAECRYKRFPIISSIIPLQTQ